MRMVTVLAVVCTGERNVVKMAGMLMEASATTAMARDGTIVAAVATLLQVPICDSDSGNSGRWKQETTVRAGSVQMAIWY